MRSVSQIDVFIMMAIFCTDETLCGDYICSNLLTAIRIW